MPTDKVSTTCLLGRLKPHELLAYLLIKTGKQAILGDGKSLDALFVHTYRMIPYNLGGARIHGTTHHTGQRTRQK